MRRTTLGLLAALAAAAPAWAGVSIGASAPDFTLPRAAGGGTVALHEEAASHKATVVMFVATRCPVSNAYNERMEALEKRYGPRGVRFLGVNSNVTEPAAEVAAHAREHGFTFPVLKDDGSRVADLYGAQHTPEIFVVGPQGTLLYHGRIDENARHADEVRSPDLANALDAILAGRAVPAAETKAFGCSIKRP